MIVRLIRVYVKEDRVDDFIEVTKKNHEGSIREEGVLRFDCLQSAEDPTEFLLYEVYRDKKATELHKETGHYSEWKQKVESMMSKPRDRSEYRVIAPSDPDRW